MVKKVTFSIAEKKYTHYKTHYDLAFANCIDDKHIFIRLQERLKVYTGLQYWIFTDCCTDALLTCLVHHPHAMIPAYGWPAAARMMELLGYYYPVYIDCNIEGNIDAQRENEYSQSSSESFVVIHNFGNLVDISSLNQSRLIIQDAAQAFPKVPTQFNGDGLVCFSFDKTKWPGTFGSGGAIATNNEELYNKLNTYLKEVHIKSTMGNLEAVTILTDLILLERFNLHATTMDIASSYSQYTENRTPNNKIYHCFLSGKLHPGLEDVLYVRDHMKWVSEPLGFAKLLAETTTMLPCNPFLKDEEISQIIKAL